MSVTRKFSDPWHALMASAGVFALSGSLCAVPALAAPPHYADTMPLSQIKPGMTGYGLTTFKGTTISKFQVTVIGILPKANEGHDLILIRMKGGPITQRGAYLIHGMSGSPIYINGKVIGAFAMGEQFPREPIGMVTPIQDMLEAWDPNIPQQPSFYLPADKLPGAPSQGGVPANRVSSRDRSMLNPWNLNREHTITLPQPILVGNRRITRLVINARPDDPRPSTENTAMLHRATSLLSVSGLTERDRQWFQKELDKRGYALTVMGTPGMAAKGQTAVGFRGAPLKPGSAFGTWLATGDVQVGGTGTITYRRGDRVLGFGHPLMGLGALNAAVSSAYVLDIFPGLDSSHHIAVPGPIIGTLRQDRDFSVSADLGTVPQLIPFDITVHDHTTLRTHTYHASVFQNPDLTPLLLRMVAKNVITEAHDFPGDAMARVTTTVEAGEVGKVTRSNIAFDAADIATIATSDLSEITNVVSGNPFYPLPIKSAHMTVDITSGHNTATVERIFLKQGKYEPGDTLDIGVVLKPYRRDPIVRNVSLRIPADTPSGRYALLVRGGTAPMTRIGSFVLSGGGDPQTPPVNVRQMINRLNEHEQNTDLVARLILNSVAPALEGEKLSQLPPNLAMLMRSDRNSGVRLERDELRAVSSTDYVVSGTQQLVVTVQRKNTQEPTGSGNYNGSQPSLLPGGRSPFDGTGGNGLLGASANDEDATTGARSPELRWNTELERWLKAVAGVRQQGDPPVDEQPTPQTDDDDSAEDAQATQAPKPAGSKQTARDKTATSSSYKVTDGDQATAPAPAVATATAPADAGNEKPIGRQLQTWRQTAAMDFASGKFNGASVAANGELRLAPRLRRLASSGETYVWSMVADNQGNLYAGTGTGGKILKVDLQGQVTTFAALPVISVQTLLMGHDGTLWAGSGVKGNLYRVRPDGSFTTVTTLPEKYILALAQDSKGNLYIGPGGGGTVYRIPADQAAAALVKPEPYLKTSADHIMALHVDAHDNLFVGTGTDGILYKVTSDGKSSVLYDAKENSITAVSSDANGNIYIGTGPKALLYRIAPDGTPTVIYDRATSFFTALRTAPDGTLYASTVNTVYHIHPSHDHDRPDLVHPLDNPKDVDILTLGILPNGGVVAGTGNVGEIYTSIPDRTEPAGKAGTYESVVHDARNISRWGALHAEALLNSGTAQSAIRAETRSGNVAEPDATWSDWSPVALHGAADLEGRIMSPMARFIQYRLTLTDVADSGSSTSSVTHDETSPGVRSISITYMPRNQAPRVVFQSPQGGERWSKTQTVRWNGSDPDNDTLTYDLFLSTDGVNWKPLPTTGKSGALIGGISGAKPETVAAMPESMKQMLAANTPLRPAGSSIASGGIGSLRTPTKSWDTTSVPDGIYRLKVIATDRASNPVDAQTSEVVSEPFLICNTPPSLTLSPAPMVATNKAVTITGSASQTMIVVSAVQYRVDGGDWIAAVPKDGLFDSPQASFTATTMPLLPGKHTIDVTVFNSAGDHTSQKVEVLGP